MKRRGIVAILSDFQDREFERPLGILRRRHDVIALRLRDPREDDVPAAGLVALLDPETGTRVVVDTSDPDVRRRLQHATASDSAAIFRRTGVGSLTLSTAEAYDRPLRTFFKAREKRR
jgi:hypothetical protein